MTPRILASFLLVFAAALSAAAQARPAESGSTTKKNQRGASVATPTPTPSVDTSASGDDEVIKVTTQLVSIPVRVMDRKGRFIGGLAKENFRVFENGTEQEVAHFSNENEPFTVALMLDMSYSTKFKIGEIQAAAIAFIDQLRPQDKVMVVSFDDEIHVHCDPTSDRKEIYRAIRSTKIATGTSLYEAIDSVMNDRMRAIDGRKAIILFSDGVDTTSRRANDLGNLYDAMELDALIYTIRYDTFSDVQAMKNRPIVEPPKISVPSPTSTGSSLPELLPTVMSSSSQGTTREEYEKAAEYLDQLALRTGGRRYDALSLTNLSDAYSKIASELREFYSVSYYPADDRTPGRSNSVKVRVDRDGVVVRARETFTNRRDTTKKIRFQSRPE